MSDRPSVSVVVPFHDSEGTLAVCIESLLAQTGVEGDYEIILIDNRSADGSAAIARRYEGPVLLEEPKPGAYAARNTGVRTARAPLIAFTDADCVVAPDWVHAIQEGMREPRTGVLVGHCRFGDKASTWLRLLAAYENAKADYVLENCPPANHFAYANNMAVRASVFEQLGPFREWRRAADSELVHRLATRQSELHLVYRPAMRVTHLEFLEGRERARRLRLYQSTNSKIETFRELGAAQRLGVLVHLVRGRRANC